MTLTSMILMEHFKGHHCSLNRNRLCLQRIIVCVLLLIVSSGCTTVGPDYTQPDTDAVVETHWIESGDKNINSEPPVEPEWWQNAFQDPQLNQLIDRALQQNLSLRSAGLLVLQSQQQLAIAVGNQYPQQQQFTGLASRELSEQIIFNDFDLGFNLSWEIDFWGRFRRQVESASAILDASVANYDAVIVSLVSQVAQNYILIRTYQKRIEVARSNIDLQEQSLQIAKAKFNAGEVSELDLDQAKTLLYNTMASVSALEISLQQLKNSLAVLLGVPPQEFNGLLDEQRQIPSVPATIALGMPQDLIRRRPDIRVAERQLAAQSAQIGYAETELYPQFSIGGSIGTTAMISSELFDNASKTWNLFGAFQWNIFNYGRLKSNVRLQDATFQQLLVDYLNTVLQAQGDAENAIVAFFKTQEQFAYYQLSVEASQRTVDISNIQYQNGSITFNTVITNLSKHVQQQDLMASTQGSVATSLVQVYKALGGGWEIRENQDPVDFLPPKMKQEMLERTRAWKGVLEK